MHRAILIDNKSTSQIWSRVLQRSIFLHSKMIFSQCKMSLVTISNQIIYLIFNIIPKTGAS